MSSFTCAHVSRLEVRPFRRETALCNAGIRAMLAYVIFPRTETARCKANICVITGANKQTPCFGHTLNSVLAQSETAGERCLNFLLGRGTHIMALCIHI